MGIEGVFGEELELENGSQIKTTAYGDLSHPVRLIFVQHEDVYFQYGVIHYGRCKPVFDRMAADCPSERIVQFMHALIKNKNRGFTVIKVDDLRLNNLSPDKKCELALDSYMCKQAVRLN